MICTLRKGIFNKLLGLRLHSARAAPGWGRRTAEATSAVSVLVIDCTKPDLADEYWSRIT
jgi:hypothetical protein